MAGTRALRLGRILPGLPQLLRGRALEGGFALFLWVTLLVLGVARWDRIQSAAIAGGLDERLAVLVLMTTLVGVWVWSFREVGRGQGESQTLFGGPGVRRFRQSRVATFALGALFFCFLIALITPLLAPFDPLQMRVFAAEDMALRLAPPSNVHLLGTDQFGRDVFSRTLYGARISLGIGLLAVTISVSIGTVLGGVAGYLGGMVDGLVMRFSDMVMAFPSLILLIAIAAVFQPSILLIVLILGLTQWPAITRIVRGEVLSLMEREFVEAARASGFSRRRILFRHILPNALAPIIVAATLGIGNTIVLEAGLSFLGQGVPQPTPSWGAMVADGRDYLMDAWWIATFPGLAIVVVFLALTLVGDGLRDALDPRQGKGLGG